LAVEDRLLAIEGKIDELIERVALLEGQQNSLSMMIKWVVFPMLVIVAGLVGIKLVLPT